MFECCWAFGIESKVCPVVEVLGFLPDFVKKYVSLFEIHCLLLFLIEVKCSGLQQSRYPGKSC